MLTKKVTDDDNFLSLSSSAQALYLHLSMSADDDGFCNQVSASMFKAHASVQDLQALLEKRYIYQFENGVIVIKHWRMANALRKDRYTQTAFKDELARLKIKDNGVYTMAKDGDASDDGCRLVAVWLPQDRLDKNRLDKSSIDKNSINVSSLRSDTLSDSKSDLEEIVALWNTLDGLGDIKAIRGIGDKGNRINQTRARLKEYGIDGFKDAIEKIKQSDFLQGKHKGKPWAITFDWLIKPSNFPKVIEGNYDTRTETLTSKAADDLEASYRMMADWSKNHE